MSNDDMIVSTEVTEEFDSLTNTSESGLTSEETTFLARIPILAGSNKKAAYLAYRSCGFTIKQSADLVGCTLQNVHHWRKNDKVFRNIEQNELSTLQSTVGNDVIRFEFMRNMRMLLHHDMKLIAKAMIDVNLSLSPREYELFKNLRRFYTPADMLALEKILHPEAHKDNAPVTINLTWGSGAVDRISQSAPKDYIEGEVTDER